MHFHAIIRLDGVDPVNPKAVVPPPAGFTAADLKAAVNHAARVTSVHTDPHPAAPVGRLVDRLGATRY